TNRYFYGRDDAPTEADDASDDSTNAWVVAHARTQPVAALLAAFRWAHERLERRACAYSAGRSGARRVPPGARPPCRGRRGMRRGRLRGSRSLPIDEGQDIARDPSRSVPGPPPRAPASTGTFRA